MDMLRWALVTLLGLFLVLVFLWTGVRVVTRAYFKSRIEFLNSIRRRKDDGQEQQ